MSQYKKKFVVHQKASSERGMREREREGGGVGGRRVTRDELENELAGTSTLNQRHKCADLPSSWRLTSTRTHSLPRTLVFRGFTEKQRKNKLWPKLDAKGKKRVFRTFCSSRAGKPQRTTLKLSGVAKNTAAWSLKCSFGW